MTNFKTFDGKRYKAYQEYTVKRKATQAKAKTTVKSGHGHQGDQKRRRRR